MREPALKPLRSSWSPREQRQAVIGLVQPCCARGGPSVNGQVAHATRTERRCDAGAKSWDLRMCRSLDKTAQIFYNSVPRGAQRALSSYSPSLSLKPPTPTGPPAVA